MKGCDVIHLIFLHLYFFSENGLEGWEEEQRDQLGAVVSPGQAHRSLDQGLAMEVGSSDINQVLDANNAK